MPVAVVAVVAEMMAWSRSVAPVAVVPVTVALIHRQQRMVRTALGAAVAVAGVLTAAQLRYSRVATAATAS